jgi:hypothetical protein
MWFSSQKAMVSVTTYIEMKVPVTIIRFDLSPVWVLEASQYVEGALFYNLIVTALYRVRKKDFCLGQMLRGQVLLHF